MKISQILAICMLLSNATAIRLDEDPIVPPPVAVETETDVNLERSKAEAVAASALKFKAAKAAKEAADAAKQTTPESAGADLGTEA